MQFVLKSIRYQSGEDTLIEDKQDGKAKSFMVRCAKRDCDYISDNRAWSGNR